MIIEPAHLAYLVVQRGMLDSLRGRPEVWKEAYEIGLQEDLEELRPYLPVRSVLDIGSGLGGICALINSECNGIVRVRLLDGIEDKPKVLVHAKTFNSMIVAEDFLKKNGVHRFSYVGQKGTLPHTFDLVLSLHSWCFHYPPNVHMAEALDSCHDGTTLVIDVRRGNNWRKMLACFFEELTVVREGRKADRIAYRAQLNG